MCKQKSQRDSFPKPLLIQMGEGRLLLSKYTTKDKQDSGVIISDTGEPHEIGSDAGMPPDPNYTPKKGRVWIQFGKKESAEALRDVINEVIDEWPA